MLRGGPLALLLVTLVVSGPAAAQTVSDPTLVVQPIVTTGLTTPTTMAFLGPDDFLVLERTTGQVRRVIGGVLQPDPVLAVPVSTLKERGLLGIAINDESPPHVFLYYTEADPNDGTVLGNRIYRYRWNPQSGQLEEPDLLLTLPVSDAGIHDGGALTLGPAPAPGPGLIGDGRTLYAVIGDLSNFQGQLQNYVAGPSSDDAGIVVALAEDGTPAPGHPFTPYCHVTTSQTCAGDGDCPSGETCETKVANYFAYGVRNCFGLAVDPVTGSLWDTENGVSSYDEVNLVTPGFNSGWATLMGPASVTPGAGPLFSMPGFGLSYHDPQFSWVTSVAPTGILFPVGSNLGSAYDDVALVADYIFGQIYRFPLNADRDGFDLSAFPPLLDLVADGTDGSERDLLRFGGGFGGISDLTLGPDGDVYVVSYKTNAVYRIAPATAATPTATVVAATATASAPATPSPTSSADPNATATPLATDTLTASATPSAASATPSASPTPVATATPTATTADAVTLTATTTPAAATATTTPIPTPTATNTPFGCGATPAPCRTPASGKHSILTLHHQAGGARDSLSWKWAQGPATTKDEFGHPESSDAYALCIYDATGLVVAAEAPAGRMCGRVPCWRPSRHGVRYSDRTLAPDGLRTISLREGADGHAEIQVQGAGPALALPSVGSLASPLTVQLTHAGGECFGARYSSPPVVRNHGAALREAAD